MTDPLGIAPTPVPTAPMMAPAAAAPAVELLTALPVMPSVATFAATVVGRSPEGVVLLRSAYGTLSVKTGRALPDGARVELRVQGGNPPGLSIVSVDTGGADEDAPPMQVNLGTTIAATVLAPGADAGDVAAGTRLLLRILAPFLAADPEAIAGQVIASGGAETVVETPIGTLALDRQLALPPGTAIALTRLGELPSAPNASAAPSQAGGWSALDQALAALDQAAPALAAQLRAALAPGTPAALAGTLLFFMGALYRGTWPGAAVGKALTAAGADALRLRLGDDLAELERLSTDEATGSWRVLVLPFLADAGVQPLRLYLRRGGNAAGGTDEDTRFVIEAEMSRLGALQFDGMVRGKRLDLVLRSHAPLAPELRQEAEALFHRVSDTNGLHGDIVFATAAQFAVAPLAGRQAHVEVRA